MRRRRKPHGKALACSYLQHEADDEDHESEAVDSGYHDASRR